MSEFITEDAVRYAVASGAGWNTAGEKVAAELGARRALAFYRGEPGMAPQSAVERNEAPGGENYDPLVDFEKWHGIIGASCSIHQPEFLSEMDAALRDYVRMRDEPAISIDDVGRIMLETWKRLENGRPGSGVEDIFQTMGDELLFRPGPWTAAIAAELAKVTSYRRRAA